MNTLKKNDQFFFILSIVLLGLVDALPNVMAPVIADFAKLYPNVRPELLSQILSVPTLFFIFASLIAGTLVRKFGYYKVIITSLILVLLGGLAPMAVLNFYAVLILRAFFGAGIGILMTISKTVVVILFEGDLRARLMGYDNTLGIMLISALQIAAGYIALRNVAASYIVHIFAAIPLILIVIFRKQIKSIDPKAAFVNKNMHNSKQTGKITFYAILLIVIMVVRSIPTVTVIYNMSSLVYELGIGDAATAGWLSTGMSIGSVAAGVSFIYIYRKAGGFTAVLGLFIETLGHLVFGFAQTISWIYVSQLLIAVGMITFVTAITMDINEVTPRNMIETAMGLVVSLPYISNFVQPYYQLLLSNVIRNYSLHKLFIVGIIIEMLSLATLFIYSLFKKKSEKQA